MKKNKKVLLASIAAMGALAIGVGATSTYAWYLADSSASVTDASPASSGTLTVGITTGSSSNNFTITPSSVTLTGTVAYTDSAGLTYVSIPSPSGYTKKQGATSAAKAVAIELKGTITYSGDLTTKEDVQALFRSKVNTVTLTVSCASVTTGASYSVAGTPATTDIRGVADIDADETGPLAISKASNTITFSSATTTGQITFGTVYVALTGSDSLVVDATHKPTYTLQIAASHA